MKSYKFITEKRQTLKDEIKGLKKLVKDTTKDIKREKDDNVKLSLQRELDDYEFQLDQLIELESY